MMIGVILIFNNKVTQVDLLSLFKTISTTDNVHFCIVSSKNSQEITDSLNELEKVTNKVSVINVKGYGNKSKKLKVASRYLKGYINLDYVGYFEFIIKSDKELFSNVMKSFNNDSDLLVKIKLLGGIKNLKRMINKNIFSIIDLFNVYYRNT